MKAFMATMFFITTTAAAFAQSPEETVQVVYMLCKQNDAFCGSYIHGISELIMMNGMVLEKATTVDSLTRSYLYELSLCMKGGGGPSGVAATQAFMNWAAAHPEKWNEGALLGVTLALSNTWPCKLTH
jgi:hypothetical protein